MRGFTTPNGGVRPAWLLAADEAAGERAGGLVVADGDLAGDDGGDVAGGALHEASASGGQVEDDLRLTQLELVVVDHVEIGAVAGCETTAVAQAVEVGGVGRHPPDRGGQVDPRTAHAVAHPVREHERRTAGVDRGAAVRATVAESPHRRRVLEHVVHVVEAEVEVVGEREHHQVAAVALGEEVVDDLLSGTALALGDGGHRVVGPGLPLHRLAHREHVRERLVHERRQRVVELPVRLGQDAGAHLRIAHAGEPVGEGERSELDVARPGAEHVVLALESEQDPGGAVGDLRVDRHALVAQLR